MNQNIKDVILIVHSIMKHTIHLDEKSIESALGKVGNIIKCLTSQMSYVYTELSKISSENYLSELFEFWRKIVMKLISSQCVVLRRTGWSEVQTLIGKTKQQSIPPPPISYTVSGAGCDIINGCYDIDSTTVIDSLGPLIYRQRDNIGNTDGKPLYLYQSTLKSGNTKWFLSEAYNDQPGSYQDKDYYTVDGKGSLPPSSGWSPCGRGREPPPSLEQVSLKTPEDEADLEHQLAKWAIESGTIELALSYPYYTGQSQLLQFVKKTNGFAYLATHLTSVVATEQFPTMSSLKKLLTTFHSPSNTDIGLQASHDNSLLIIEAVFNHLLSLDKVCLEKSTVKSFGEIRSQLLQYMRTPSSPDFYDIWKKYTLKLIKAKSLELNLLGWEEVSQIIVKSEETRHPPTNFVVLGAGIDYANGKYELCGYTKPNDDIQYRRTVSTTEGEVKTLCIQYENSYWVLTDVHNNTKLYKQYSYGAKSWPQPWGWVAFESVVGPAPTLKAGSLLIPEGEEYNTLEHQLAEWAIKNKLIELSLGQSTKHDIVPKAKPLIRFLAGNNEKPYPVELSEQYCLKASHLLLAMETCQKASVDNRVLSAIYHLCFNIRPSLPKSMQEINDTITKDTMMLRVERSDPTLLALFVGGSNAHRRQGLYVPTNENEFLTLGRNIGSNTHLKTVRFDSTFTFEGVENDIVSSFVQGFEQNKSIRTITLDSHDISERAGIAILNSIMERESDLTELSLNSCGLSNGRMNLLRRHFFIVRT